MITTMFGVLATNKTLYINHYITIPNQNNRPKIVRLSNLQLVTESIGSAKKFMRVFTYQKSLNKLFGQLNTWHKANCNEVLTIIIIPLIHKETDTNQQKTQMINQVPCLSTIFPLGHTVVLL